MAVTDLAQPASGRLCLRLDAAGLRAVITITTLLPYYAITSILEYSSLVHLLQRFFCTLHSVLYTLTLQFNHLCHHPHHHTRPCGDVQALPLLRGSSAASAPTVFPVRPGLSTCIERAIHHLSEAIDPEVIPLALPGSLVSLGIPRYSREPMAVPVNVMPFPPRLFPQTQDLG